MKKTLKLMLCGIMLIAACQNKNEKVQTFIDGIYVNHARGAYSIADDTLAITHTQDNRYIITRNTGYQAIRDGRLLPKKHKLEKVDGIFDSKTGLLMETAIGRVFSFDPNKDILVLKRAVYCKIN